MISLVFWREREQRAEAREQGDWGGVALDFLWFCLFVLFFVALAYVVMAC